MVWIGCHPTHSLIDSEYRFRDTVRYTEFIACGGCFLLFNWFFLCEKGKFLKGYFRLFFIGDETENIKNNCFYCWLMLATTVVIIYFNVHLINVGFKDKFIVQALKVWEITAYWLTTIYTCWFWLNKKRGFEVLATMNQKQGVTGIFLGISITLLLGFAVVHTLLFIGETFNPWIDGFIETNETLLSLALIVVVYTLFININIWIINNTSDTLIKEDFKTMHKYLDRPTFVIFIIMFFFAFYVRLVGCLSSMENFFSGAIAFELILSSIVYANTNTF
jgi:hypothetical protein